MGRGGGGTRLGGAVGDFTTEAVEVDDDPVHTTEDATEGAEGARDRDEDAVVGRERDLSCRPAAAVEIRTRISRSRCCCGVSCSWTHRCSC